MRVLIGLSVALVALWSCQDAGTEPPGVATVTGVFPDSAAVGDTILITGTSFGAAQGASTLTIGGATATVIVSWSDTRIIVGVPPGAASGAVRINISGQLSNTAAFKTQTTPEARVSFAGQVLPIVTTNGCPGCHGGTNNLVVTTYANLMLGNSNHGPVVTPYNGEGSVIVRKLRGTAGFGNRMPQGGPYLSDANIEIIARWIKQGARNN